jgi:hypothetical protein
VLAGGGLVVHHVNRRGGRRDYDFAVLPVAEPMQRSLAALFAARCVPHRWSAHATSETRWGCVRNFAQFLAAQPSPITDLDGLTPALVKGWRLHLGTAAGGVMTFNLMTGLLREDPRLHGGPVAEELARRARLPHSRVQSFPEAEFDKVRVAARRTFRLALLRIGENAAHLERWRAGQFAHDSGEAMLGEALDVLARTADLPRYRDGQITKHYRRVLGGTSEKATWGRLFLSRQEAVALAVLLMAEFGWNLSTLCHLEVPRALPDPGADGRPTYRIALEKYRRGSGQQHETRNVTDDGAGSRGRLITEALAATRFARALVEQQAPGTDLLLVWHSGKRRVELDHDRHPPVGHFGFGLHSHDARLWAANNGIAGSPFRRGRRTVLALDRREPAQHSQDTHDRHYALVDKRVQDEATAVIADGASDALARARTAVLLAELRDAPTLGDDPTATADCSDADASPFPAPGGGCAASFLLCLACPNAHVHPGHHPRLTRLHHAITNLRTVLPARQWHADWADTHARLEQLRYRLGEGVWRQAAAQVTVSDIEIIDLLLSGELNP